MNFRSTTSEIHLELPLELEISWSETGGDVEIEDLKVWLAQVNIYPFLTESDRADCEAQALEAIEEARAGDADDRAEGLADAAEDAGPRVLEP